MTRGALPGGLVTFMFSDVCESTRLIQAIGDGYLPMLMEYRRILRSVLPSGGGIEMSVEADAGYFVFVDATAGLLACASAQRMFSTGPWPSEVARPSVRIGLNTGFADPVDGEYVSAEVHRAARVAGLAGAGQVLCTAATARAARLPAAQGRFVDIGLHHLRGFARNERLYALTWSGSETPRSTARPRSRPAGKTLTRAESEVARLVTEGLSNTRIAQRLYLSRFTVESHLKHIFAKLGVSSRAEMTAVLIRRQMVDDV